MNQREQREQIKALFLETNQRKAHAVEQYRSQIRSLKRSVEDKVDAHHGRVESEFRQELGYADFTGFGKEEKIEKFNRCALKPLMEQHQEKLGKSLAMLGDDFYLAEKQLEERLECAIQNLKDGLSSIGSGVKPPNISYFRSERRNRDSKLFDALKDGRYVVTGVVSAIVLLGFSQAAFAADTATDAAGHATAHGVGHATAHGAGHAASHAATYGAGHIAGHATAYGAGHVAGHAAAYGAGHAAAHGAGSLIGAAIPGLNIALLCFSSYKIIKFFSDDSEVKDKVEKHTIGEISKYYNSVSRELKTKLSNIEDKFVAETDKLFAKCLEPTSESAFNALMFGIDNGLV